MSLESHQNVNGCKEDSDDEPLLLAPAEAERQPCKLVALPEVGTFLYFMALVTQYPVVQFWLVDHFAKEYNLTEGNDTDVCGNTTETNSSYSNLEQKVQSEVNQYAMYTSFVSYFVAVFPTLLLGPLTDKFGRKFVWYVSFLGLFICQVITLLVFQFDLTPDLLFVSSFFTGLSGSYGLFLTGAFGMVADITPPGKQRGFRVTTVEATIAIAASLGITLSGIWVKEIGYVWPMVISMATVALATLFVLFATPETLVDRHYRPFSCRTFLKSFEFYVKDTPDKRRLKLVICLVCFLTTLTGFIGESNFSILFLLHQPFCWHKVPISIFSGTLTLLKWICVMLFILVCKRWVSDPVFAIIGSLSAASGYLMKGLAWSNLFIFIGALFAGIGVLQMIVSASAGIIMSSIYNVGLKVYLGLPYLVLTGLVSINVFLLIALILYTRWHPNVDHATETEERPVD